MLFIGRSLTFLPKIQKIQTLYSNDKTLTTIINNDIHKAPGNYSIYITDLFSPLAVSINEKQIHTAASVNKIPIVAVLYALSQQRKINLDEKITIQKNDIQDYGTGSLRYEKPGRTYSIKTLVKLTLKQSDNTAAHVLANKIGMDVIQKMITSWGLSQTDMKTNKSTVYDMSILFRKIYNNEITTPALTQELLGFMKNTENEKRLPKNLSSNVTVYHKTGDGVGNIHDVGLIIYKNHVYFVGVMTTDVGNYEKETEEKIAQIAKDTVSFIQSLD